MKTHLGFTEDNVGVRTRSSVDFGLGDDEEDLQGGLGDISADWRSAETYTSGPLDDDSLDTLDLFQAEPFQLLSGLLLVPAQLERLGGGILDREVFDGHFGN